MTIPKTLHYCWFGGAPKPPLVERCLASWRAVMPDYEIVEWNETTYDARANAFAARHYERGNWAKVSDAARLQILRDRGGIYLDADIQVLRSFDPLLGARLFLGFMFDCNLGTAVLGAEPGQPTVARLLALYEADGVHDDAVNNDVFTRMFLSAYPAFRLNGRRQSLRGGVEIYPKEFFHRPTYVRSMGYSVNLDLGSWKRRARPVHRRLARRILGPVLYAKVAHRSQVRRSQWYATYREHSRR